MASNWFRRAAKDGAGRGARSGQSGNPTTRILSFEPLEDRTVPAVGDVVTAATGTDQNKSNSTPAADHQPTTAPVDTTNVADDSNTAAGGGTAQTTGGTSAPSTTGSPAPTSSPTSTSNPTTSPTTGTTDPAVPTSGSSSNPGGGGGTSAPESTAAPLPPTVDPNTPDGKIAAFMAKWLKQAKGVKPSKLDVLKNGEAEGTKSFGTMGIDEGVGAPTSSSSGGSNQSGGSPTALTVVSETEPNDTAGTANPIPLGTGGAGTDTDVQVNGAIGTNNDVDFFSFTLRAGDILGATVAAAGGNLDATLAIFDPNGTALMANDDDAISTARAPESTLPASGGGNSPYVNIVAGTAGRYTIAVASSQQGSSGNYTMTLGARRPVLESAAPGVHQKIFLDFDGGTVPANVFGTAGPVTFSPLSTFLPGWGLTAADQNAVIDSIVAQVKSQFAAVSLGGAQPGTNPNYTFEILNSRDNPDTFGTDPSVSRVFIGGTIAELTISTIGLAQFVDVGNFSLDDTAVVLLDLLSGPASDPNSLNSIPLGPGQTITDLIGRAVGTIASHEAGHFVGLMHTDNADATPNIIDSGGNPLGTFGIGPDGVFGTADDVTVLNVVDTFDPNQGNSGNEDTTNHVAWGLTAQAAPVSNTKSMFAFDVSLSMIALEGLDVNGDGTVNKDDDFNDADGTGTLLDFALNDAAGTTASQVGVSIFGKEAISLYMDRQGDAFTTTTANSTGDGVTDFVHTLQSVSAGEGGYFSQAFVDPNPTNYDSILANIAQTADPGTSVTIYTDGAGRLSANSAALASLVQSGIVVNVVVLGPYQTVAPIDDVLAIAGATGGQVRQLPTLRGRVLDGGFPEVVAGGGSPGPSDFTGGSSNPGTFLSANGQVISSSSSGGGSGSSSAAANSLVAASTPAADSGSAAHSPTSSSTPPASSGSSTSTATQTSSSKAVETAADEASHDIDSSKKDLLAA